MNIDIENIKKNQISDSVYNNFHGNDIKVLDIKITENISKIGIVEFAILKHESEHIISLTFDNNKKCHISFFPKKISMTNLLKEIKKKLLQTFGSVNDYKVFSSSFNDIENQIIENRNKVFSISSENNHNNNPIFDIFNQFYEDVESQRNQWIKSSLIYEEWKSKVYEKYGKLRQVIEKHYSEAWTFMEFCLSVKSILNIQDFTLPFMGVLIAPPSSMKTMIIQLFRKYPHTFYTDSFTPSSIISHNSTKTEEELQKVDMFLILK